MKGSMIDIFATLIFIGFIIGLVTLLNSQFVVHRGNVETSLGDIKALQAAYAVESCFLQKSGDNYITAEFLESEKGKFIGLAEFCNIPSPEIYVEVKDAENGNTWEFPASGNSHDYNINIPILYNSVFTSKEDDIVFYAWRKYVVEYSKVRDTGVFGIDELAFDDINLDIYPIENYEKSTSNLPTVEIKKDDDLENFIEKMYNTETGANILINTLRSRIRVSEIEDAIKKFKGGGVADIASNPSECGDSKELRLCMFKHEREIHGGELHVKI